jgi:hypothetical protein
MGIWYGDLAVLIEFKTLSFAGVSGGENGAQLW